MHASPNDLDLPKCNHLVPPWPRVWLTKFGDNRTWIGARKLLTDIPIYLPRYQRWQKRLPITFSGVGKNHYKKTISHCIEGDRWETEASTVVQCQGPTPTLIGPEFQYLTTLHQRYEQTHTQPMQHKLHHYHSQLKQSRDRLTLVWSSLMAWLYLCSLAMCWRCIASRTSKCSFSLHHTPHSQTPHPTTYYTHQPSLQITQSKINKLQ